LFCKALQEKNVPANKNSFSKIIFIFLQAVLHKELKEKKEKNGFYFVLFSLNRIFAK